MRRHHRTGFTLIELLVVIAIIAILAAILFPVFAQAREKARSSACISNVRQMGTAAVMYAQDYDETYPGMWMWNPFALRGHSPYLIKPFGQVISWERAEQECQTCPYVKNAQVFRCPSQNSPASYGYAYPTMWGKTITTSTDVTSTGYFPVGPNLAEFSHPADTVMIMDSGYWPNGNALKGGKDWSFASGYPYAYKYGDSGYSQPLPIHSEMCNIAFVDGHVKAMRPEATVRPVDMWLRQR